MANAGEVETTDAEAPARSRRKVGYETVLAVCGAVVAIGFFVPWWWADSGDQVSGLSFAQRGGAWLALVAIPVLAGLTAVFGGLRWKASRYTGWLTGVAVAVPTAYALAHEWPWLYTIPLALGIAALVAGMLERAPWLNLPLGGGLIVLSALTALLGRDELPADIDRLGLLVVAPLLALAALVPLCGIWLVWTGLRKKKLSRPVVVTGWLVIALSVYGAALVAFGPMIAASGPGLAMTAIGGAFLLVGARPIASRRKRRAKAEKSETKAKPEPKKAEAKKKPEAKKEPEAKKPEAKKPEAKKPEAKKPEKAAPAEDAGDADELAAKKAKLEKLKKLKKLQKLRKLKELQARKAAAEAADEEAETAKAGEALASDPEPAFAADPTAPPAPEDEDREALMKRMGVKPPPPPSEGELEDMLAALKQRAGDD